MISFTFNNSLVELPAGCVISASKVKDIARNLALKLQNGNPFQDQKKLNQQKVPFNIEVTRFAFSFLLSSTLNLTPDVRGKFFPDNSLGACFGLDFTEKFLKESDPYCPKCGENLRISLPKVDLGTLVLAFKIDDKLKTADLLEMFDLNYFISKDFKLIRAEKEVLRNEIVYGVLYSANNVDELSQYVENYLNAGFEELFCFHYLNRRDSGKFLHTFSQNPFCEKCRYQLKPLTDETLFQESGWQVKGKNAQQIRNCSANQVKIWLNETCPEFEVIEKLGLSNVPLNKTYFSSGELVRLALGMLLKLNDCVIFFDGIFQIFTEEEQKKYYNIIDALAAQGNTCILLDDIEDYQFELNFVQDKLQLVRRNIRSRSLVSKNIKKKQSYSIKYFKDYFASLMVLSGESGGGKTQFLNQLATEKNIVLENGRVLSIEMLSLPNSGGNKLLHLSGLAPKLTELYANTLAARLAGYIKKDFSLLSSRFLCKMCHGQAQVITTDGVDEVEGNSLLNANYDQCPCCAGTGFSEEILEVEWQGKNIAALLNLTIDEAMLLVADYPSINERLKLLSALGFAKYYLRSAISSNLEYLKIALLQAISKRRANNCNVLLLIDDILNNIDDKSCILAYLKRFATKGNAILLVSNQIDSQSWADVTFYSSVN